MSIRQRRHKKEVPDLDITAFLNLMVVLVPFLLISAVFTQVTVIELNMPPPANDDQQQEEEEKEKLSLEIIIRADKIEVAGGKGGHIKSFKQAEDGSYPYEDVTALLKKLKTKYPEETTSMILAEPDTDYDTLVHVMDTVRLYEFEENDTVIQAELFPDMSIGDAPALLKKGK